jgi:hypothetical protein
VWEEDAASKEATERRIREEAAKELQRETDLKALENAIRARHRKSEGKDADNEDL